MTKSFAGKIATLLSGTVLSQALSIFLIPVISRLYLPAETGMAETFFAIVFSLSVGINGGYELAIMLPPQKEEAMNLSRLGLVICIFLSLAIFIILGILYFFSPLPVVGNLPLFWVFLIPLSVMMEGMSQVFRVLMNRNGKYKTIASGKLFNVIFKNGLSVLIGYLSGSYFWLILSFLIGQAVNLLIYGRAARLSGFRFMPLDFGVLRILITKYKDFLQFATLSAWLNSLFKKIHFFLMPVFFAAPASVLGVFGMAEKILMIPIFLSLATGEVFYQKIAGITENTEAEIRKITLNTFYFLLASGTVIYGILCVPGESFYSWVLGEEYKGVSDYFRAFSLYTLGTFIVIPLSYLVDVKRKMGQFLVLNALLLVLRSSAFVAGSTEGNETSMKLFYGAGSAMIVLIQIGYLLNLAGKGTIVSKEKPD
ncbi:MAG: oligosaccharide flippase family protein [Bacteroidia bacterium]|nr:oligosaccharide flippase family protein [Bacteroidia bacterium]